MDILFKQLKVTWGLQSDGVLALDRRVLPVQFVRHAGVAADGSDG